MVELNSLSTRMRKCIYFMNFIVYGLDFGRSLDSWEKLGTLLYILSLHFWLREDQGFAALFGIHVALCVDGVLLSVFVSCYVYHFPSLIFCN